MERKNTFAYRSRSSTGAALAGGVASLGLLTALIMAFLVLIVNTGLVLWGAQKLYFVCVNSAIYATSQTNKQAQTVVPPLAQTLVADAGLTVNGKKPVTVNPVTISGKPAYTVTISATIPLLFNVFGASVPFTCSATVPTSLSQFGSYNGVVYLNDVGASCTGAGGVGMYYIPCFYSSAATEPSQMIGTVPITSAATVTATQIMATEAKGPIPVFSEDFSNTYTGCQINKPWQ